MIYLDTNVIIRFVEGDSAARAPLESRLRGTGPFLTSQLSRLECRCLPLRRNDTQLLALYDGFFSSADLLLVDIDAAVIDKATELRAPLNVRTPDAIHLASGILSGASAFLTGDQALVRCADVRVEVVS